MSFLRALRDRLDRMEQRAISSRAATKMPPDLPWTATGGTDIATRMRLAGLPPAPGSEEPPDDTDSVKLFVRIVGGPWGDGD